MKQPLLCCLFLMLLSNLSISVQADTDNFLGPRDRHALKSSIDNYFKHHDEHFRYGNWYGINWRGDVTDTNQASPKAPVDSLDIIAQRHSFAYQIAEQQGKIHGIFEEKHLKAVADYLAVYNARILSRNPKKWPYPPAIPNKAAHYRDLMITGFSYEETNDNPSATTRNLDWATTPIENWQPDKAQRLTINALETEATRLQNDWTTKNLTSDHHPTNPAPVTDNPPSTAKKDVKEAPKTAQPSQSATPKKHQKHH